MYLINGCQSGKETRQPGTGKEPRGGDYKRYILVTQSLRTEELAREAEEKKNETAFLWRGNIWAGGFWAIRA